MAVAVAVLTSHSGINRARTARCGFHSSGLFAPVASRCCRLLILGGSSRLCRCSQPDTRVLRSFVSACWPSQNGTFRLHKLARRDSRGWRLAIIRLRHFTSRRSRSPFIASSRNCYYGKRTRRDILTYLRFTSAASCASGPYTSRSSGSAGH